MQWFFNNIQFVILILAFAAPAIGTAVQKLREQQEIKRRRDDLRRQREEALRTGRGGAAEAGVAEAPAAKPGAASRDPQRLRELAAKRQAQLEALRERQRAQAARRREDGGEGSRETPVVLVPPGGGGGRGGGGVAAPPRLPQRSRGPVGGGGGGAVGRPAGQAGSGRPVVRGAEAARRRERASAAPARVVDRVELSGVRRGDGGRGSESVRRLVRSSAPGAGERRRGRTRGTARRVRELLMVEGASSRLGRAERSERLAALFALQEVLARPMSMRPDEDRGVGGVNG